MPKVGRMYWAIRERRRKNNYDVKALGLTEEMNRQLFFFSAEEEGGTLFFFFEGAAISKNTTC